MHEAQISLEEQWNYVKKKLTLTDDIIEEKNKNIEELEEKVEELNNEKD